MPSRPPAARTRDLERILGSHIGFQLTEQHGGSHHVWLKIRDDGTVLTTILLRNREFRPNTLRGLLKNARGSPQSFTALFHKMRKGHQLSADTVDAHPDVVL